MGYSRRTAEIIVQRRKEKINDNLAGCVLSNFSAADDADDADFIF